MARRSAAGVLAVFAVIDVVGTMVAPLDPVLTLVVGYLYPALLLGWGVLLLRAPWRWLEDAMVLNPLFATALIVVLDVLTKDSSPGGQIAFCAPVLYAASQLRVGGAVVVLVAAMAGELTTVLVLEPPDQALADAAYVSVILVTITVLLAIAGVRQDRMTNRLRHLATIDPLTGLVTRRVFDEAAQNALAATGDGGVCLVLADIDHFKTINDTFGHPVGDDALAHVAALLRGTVGDDGVLCRLGGDELAALLPACDSRGAQALAEQLVDAVRHSRLRHGLTEVPLTISAGVAFASGPGRTPLRELYAAADASLYDAKRQGRDRAGTPGDVAPAGAAGDRLSPASSPEASVAERG